MLRAVAARKAMSAQPNYQTHERDSAGKPNSARLSALTAGRATSARATSGKPVGARNMGHGNKTSILLGQLPEMVESQA